MKGELELEHEHDQQSIEDHSTVQIVQVHGTGYILWLTQRVRFQIMIKMFFDRSLLLSIMVILISNLKFEK